MFLQNGAPVNNEANREITFLLVLIVVVFLFFVGALVVLLYKLIYAHLEEEFQIQRELAKNSNLRPSGSGIRPISAIIPPQLNSQLDMMYESRRGTTGPLRNEQRLSLDKSFFQPKKVEFASHWKFQPETE